MFSSGPVIETLIFSQCSCHWAVDSRRQWKETEKCVLCFLVNTSAWQVEVELAIILVGQYTCLTDGLFQWKIYKTFKLKFMWLDQWNCETWFLWVIRQFLQSWTQVFRIEWVFSDAKVKMDFDNGLSERARARSDGAILSSMRNAMNEGIKITFLDNPNNVTTTPPLLDEREVCWSELYVVVFLCVCHVCGVHVMYACERERERECVCVCVCVWLVGWCVSVYNK